ncbi:OmpA family protein [Oceanibacterium hippocampi]|uniref:Outer membrane protein P6 n=1 Tax=Oceanibacterium hippocampi TaxID=745714 RepID=A0A1Y5RYV6_9PROT|nr:OmpA family protein [Oceanibacterium hippocampi]SLN25737.1 Outer membrane protein P6 precursor [Oceanibacterium hippocampi]
MATRKLLTGSALALVLILGIGACTTANIDALRRSASGGGDAAGGFDAALAREYLAFAELELAQQDWPDQAYFAAKGLSAASGQRPGPEALADWSLPAAQRTLIAARRETLLRWLDGGARERDPGGAARAQVLFDCWIEQQEENWQSADIAYCRDGLTAILTAAGPATAHLPTPDTPRRLVHFDFDSRELDAGAMRNLDELPLGGAGVDGRTLLIQGHSDSAGLPSYNFWLSLKRAEAVADYLRDRGADPARIRIEALGESRPRVATADGAVEPANRRVELWYAALPERDG